MGVQRPLHKVDPPFQQHDPVPLRQAGRGGLSKINRKVKGNSGNRLGAQQADAPRLDQPAKSARRAGNKSVIDGRHLHLIIRNQNSPQADHLQRKRRLAGPGRPKDQKSPAVDRDARGMQPNEMGRCHTGRPTTKRAPSGSEVTSAWVGRMFSAQITPPCASTICFEIASPRPE